MPDAVTWRRAVEATVTEYAPDAANDVLDSLAFIEALDDTLALEGDELAAAVREAVDGWLEAYSDGGDMSDADCEAHLKSLLAGLTDDQINELADLAEAMHAEGGD